MMKMVKKQVCFEKTCWSTKNTVLDEAENREEEHFKEELDVRIQPHSHKKNNKDNPENKNNKHKAPYDLNITYLKNVEFQDKKSPEYGLQLSYDQDTPKENGEMDYSLIGKNNKKVDGFVRLTLSKILKVGEYVMALTTPQWNRVPGSFEDKDSFAPTMSQKDAVSEENAKYEIGYTFFKYRD